MVSDNTSTLINLHVVLDAGSDKAAAKIIANLAKIVPATFTPPTPYRKGGYEGIGVLSVPAANWPTTIYHALTISQAFGYGWSHSGDVDSGLSLTTDKFSIPGIIWAHVSVDRTA